MTMPLLSGKSVLVVGGSSGIGLATAVAATRAGAIVSIAGRSAEKLRAASALMDDVTTIELDITDEAMTASALAAVGTADHVVVTPGAVPPTPRHRGLRAGLRQPHRRS